MKVTELKKIFCEKKNSSREVLKIKLVRKESGRAMRRSLKNLCKRRRFGTESKIMGGFDPTHNISRRPDRTKPANYHV